MKKIKISIKRLGRICDSEIEIKPLMLFSGESGMGKSYVAILVHYFFELLLDENRINRFFMLQKINYNDVYGNLKDRGTVYRIEKSILESWMAMDAIDYLKYMVNDDNLVADISVALPEEFPQVIDCSFQEEASGFQNEVDVSMVYLLPGLSYRVKHSNIGLDEESPFAYHFRHYLIKVIFGDYAALKDTFVLPPARGAMMTENIIPVSGMFKKFDKDKKSLESAQVNLPDDSIRIKELIHNVMEGSVSVSDNRQYFYKMDDSGDIPLSSAASSVRELAPLELLIENVDISKIAVLLEEPEAHLHPEKQRMMADIIGCMSRAGTAMQITTHSDFLIRRLNELIALSVLQNEKTVGFDELCAELGVRIDCIPDFDDISSFLLERQENNTSRIVKQDIGQGIPYSSFYKPLKDAVNNMRLIADFNEYNNGEDN